MPKLTFAALAVLAATTARAETGTYAIDPTHTFVTFEALHFGTSTARGRFDKKEGTVQLDRAARTGKVELTLETGSISTGLKPFDGTLSSEKFFNSAQFPTATFVGDQFKFDGDKVSEIAGTLTLLGKSNPVLLKASNFNCYMSPMLEVAAADLDLERSEEHTSELQSL